MAVSVSRETLNRTLMLVLVTVSSFDVSGTEEAKFHSSSSSAAGAALVLCAKFDDGAGAALPRRSNAADAGAGGLIDC